MAVASAGDVRQPPSYCGVVVASWCRRAGPAVDAVPHYALIHTRGLERPTPLTGVKEDENVAHYTDAQRFKRRITNLAVEGDDGGGGGGLRQQQAEEDQEEEGVVVSSSSIHDLKNQAILVSRPEPVTVDKDHSIVKKGT